MSRSETVWLGPCEMCGDRFQVNRGWFFARFWTGAPLKMCKNCHPVAHDGAPPA